MSSIFTAQTKIRLVTEGEAEYSAFPKLLPRCGSASQVLKQPLLVKVDPLAPLPVQARAISKKIVLAQSSADKVLVLIDREQRSSCSGDLAQELESAISLRMGSSLTADLKVVIKDPFFESWLIADISMLESHPKMFKPTKGDINKIAPNKADKCGAMSIINKLVKQSGSKRLYDKRWHAVRAFENADPKVIAANSRSFRRFLRLLDCPLYSSQSKQPA